MIALFSIDYKTNPGQNIFISGNIPELGGGNPEKAVPCTYTPSGLWQCEIKINTQDRVISYNYFVKNADDSTIYESGTSREIAFTKSLKKMTCMDSWQWETPVAPFLTAPFSNVLYSHSDIRRAQVNMYAKELVIRVTVPNCSKDWKIFISGETPELGGWDTNKALSMQQVFGSRWQVNLPANKISKHIRYKFIKKNLSTGEVIWENGENRYLKIPDIDTGENFTYEHSYFDYPIEQPRIAGTVVPLFSLKTKKSCGIGDFGDLRTLTDWAVMTKQNIIQLLPVNDTTTDGSWRDSYPYSTISVMALHPIYINLGMIGTFKDKVVAAQYLKERKALNVLKSVDYEKVWNIKQQYLRILFEEYSEETFLSPEFYNFYKTNKNWLLPYCAFCTLRDTYKTANFHKWGKYARYSDKMVEKLNQPGTDTYRSFSFYLFTQFHLDQQLKEAKQYAKKNRVILKGDIPIGISPMSVEAWSEPQYFNLKGQAGAPPDFFSSHGQNWGFPTYNWEAMKHDNYAWWKMRFRKMSDYFDVYRIDHILGFFRIWEIPSGQISGRTGHFNPALPLSEEEIRRYGFDLNKGDVFNALFIEDKDQSGSYHPNISGGQTDYYQHLTEKQKNAYNSISWNFFHQRHNKFWGEIGRERLSEIVKSSNLLPCAEDLGMIPECVPPVLNELRILTLHIQRMPKEGSLRFDNTTLYPYLSVCSPGTHDVNNLRSWWEENSESRAYYYYNVLREEGEVPEHCEPWICEKIITLHLNSPSMMTIIPIQDWFALTSDLRVENPGEERINLPSDPQHHWKYRIPRTLEDIMENKDFMEKVGELIITSNRRFT